MNSLEKWISYDEYLVASCIEHKLKNECKKVSNFAHKKIQCQLIATVKINIKNHRTCTKFYKTKKKTNNSKNDIIPNSDMPNETSPHFLLLIQGYLKLNPNQ